MRWDWPTNKRGDMTMKYIVSLPKSDDWKNQATSVYADSFRIQNGDLVFYVVSQHDGEQENEAFARGEWTNVREAD